MFYWLLVVCVSLCSFLKAEEDPSVLLAILARNKAHVLPHFLECIDALEYDKQQITVYINTNNNQDDTAEILNNWIGEKGSLYRNIIYENHEVQDLPPCSPHDWTKKRFHVLAEIRNRSLKMAVTTHSDFYFVVDCDNFIIPATLRDLVTHDKPIIAPLLKAIPRPEDAYSNFFTAVDRNGYWASSELYFPILYREITGVFEVPVVHCTYLIKTEYIPRLGYIDGSDDYEFVIFSRVARGRGIGQYICNEKPFGYVLHPDDKITLEEEAELVGQLSWADLIDD